LHREDYCTVRAAAREFARTTIDAELAELAETNLYRSVICRFCV